MTDSRFYDCDMIHDNEKARPAGPIKVTPVRLFKMFALGNIKRYTRGKIRSKMFNRKLMMNGRPAKIRLIHHMIMD